MTAEKVIWLLERVQVPAMRRYVEAVALHAWKVPPRIIRRVLDDFRLHAPMIHDDSVPNEVDPSKNSVAYGLRKFKDESERALLVKLFATRERMLTSGFLRKAGEHYVRHHFKRSPRYKQVTPVAKLGCVRDKPEDRQLDLAVTDTSNGVRYGVSVKNTRDFLEQRTVGWVNEISEMAQERGMMPWIITSFATPEAFQMCEDRGVRCTPMNTRVAMETYRGTNSTRKAIHRLYPTIGPEPFRFVGDHRLHEYDDDFLMRLEGAA